ncbi:EKC/KEOPS complex subunit [Arachis hypogaea]|nr:EKC/KEOPS complex subunit [Arachis hypogaea]
MPPSCTASCQSVKTGPDQTARSQPKAKLRRIWILQVHHALLMLQRAKCQTCHMKDATTNCQVSVPAALLPRSRHSSPPPSPLVFALLPPQPLHPSLINLEAVEFSTIMEETEACANHSPLVLLKQGAEARVFESNFVGRRSVIKERFSKKYRHPTLDIKLTLRRLNAEARCMTKARKLGVCTPALYAVDTVLNTLTFEYVEGPSLKEVLLEFGLKGVVEERLDDIASQVGDAIGKLHDGGLIHGDLTTSNMLLKSGTNQLVLIDFGLSFTSTLPEDKAVDLYVLERALLSMHSSCGNVMDRILAAYRKSSKQWSSTLNKLAQVRQRGRKRTMVG